MWATRNNHVDNLTLSWKLGIVQSVCVILMSIVLSGANNTFISSTTTTSTPTLPTSSWIAETHFKKKRRLCPIISTVPSFLTAPCGWIYVYIYIYKALLKPVWWANIIVKHLILSCSIENGVFLLKLGVLSSI